MSDCCCCLPTEGTDTSTSWMDDESAESTMLTAGSGRLIPERTRRGFCRESEQWILPLRQGQLEEKWRNSAAISKMPFLASFDSRGCRILKNQLGQLCDDGSRHHPTNKAEIHNCVLPLNGMRRSWSMDKSQNLRHFDGDSGCVRISLASGATCDLINLHEEQQLSVACTATLLVLLLPPTFQQHAQPRCLSPCLPAKGLTTL